MCARILLFYCFYLTRFQVFEDDVMLARFSRVQVMKTKADAIARETYKLVHKSRTNLKQAGAELGQAQLPIRIGLYCD